jgi:hypothetical protein
MKVTESFNGHVVTFTGGSDVTGFDAVRVGRGMPRAPVPFCGCGGTPHGRGSFCGAYGVRGSAVRARKRGSKTNRCRNKGGGLYSDYAQKKGCRYLVAPEPFGDDVRDLEECSGRMSEESAARTYCCSGRTWTLLALLSFRSDLEAADSSCSGRRERRVKGDGMAGVPSQWEGTGQEDGESGKAGVPSQWEGTGQESGESGKAGVPSQWEGTGQEKAGRPGFPRNGRERARKAEKAGKPGFPRNGRERARKKREKAGKPGFPRNGRERASKTEKAGRPGFPRNGRERARKTKKAGRPGFPRNERERAKKAEKAGKPGFPRNGRERARMGRWGSSAQLGVRVLSAGRNTGSGADSVDAVRAFGSALIFCTGSAKERNFSATGSVS